MTSVVANILRLFCTLYSYYCSGLPPPPSQEFPSRKPCRHMANPARFAPIQWGTGRNRRGSHPYIGLGRGVPSSPPYRDCETCLRGLCSCQIEGHIHTLQLSTRRLSAPAALPATPLVSPFRPSPVHIPDEDDQDAEWIESWLRDSNSPWSIESDSDSDTEYSSSTSQTRVESDDEMDFFSSSVRFDTPHLFKHADDESVPDESVPSDDESGPPRMHKSKRLRGVALSAHWRRHERSISPSPTPRCHNLL